MTRLGAGEEADVVLGPGEGGARDLLGLLVAPLEDGGRLPGSAASSA